MRSPMPRSRVHGPRRILAELRRVRIKTDRALAHRALSEDEQRWARRLADALDRLVTEGEAVLPGGADPREARRVRKRPLIE